MLRATASRPINLVPPNLPEHHPRVLLFGVAANPVGGEEGHQAAVAVLGAQCIARRPVESFAAVAGAFHPERGLVRQPVDIGLHPVLAAQAGGGCSLFQFAEDDGESLRRSAGSMANRGDPCMCVIPAWSPLPITLPASDPETPSCQDRNRIEHPLGERFVALNPCDPSGLYF
jgi:hypothetical protein